MTVITAKTQPLTASRGPQTPGMAVACTLDATLAASHVQSIKRFGKLILAMALLSVAPVGVVTLKSPIWITHFNY